jgi:hypothetical protein
MMVSLSVFFHQAVDDSLKENGFSRFAVRVETVCRQKKGEGEVLF